jgi:hypothetical protein
MAALTTKVSGTSHVVGRSDGFVLSGAIVCIRTGVTAAGVATRSCVGAGDSMRQPAQGSMSPRAEVKRAASMIQCQSVHEVTPQACGDRQSGSPLRKTADNNQQVT